MAFSFLKVLLGMWHFGMPGAWWKKTEGAAIAGHHYFVTSALLSFLFFLGMFCCCPSTPLASNCYIDVVAILI
jgi:hypothetical protein